MTFLAHIPCLVWRLKMRPRCSSVVGTAFGQTGNDPSQYRCDADLPRPPWCSFWKQCRSRCCLQLAWLGLEVHRKVARWLSSRFRWNTPRLHLWPPWEHLFWLLLWIPYSMSNRLDSLLEAATTRPICEGRSSLSSGWRSSHRSPPSSLSSFSSRLVF